MATEIAARNLVTTQIRRALHHLTRIDGFSAALGGVVSQGGARLVLSELHNMRCELLRGIVVAPGIGLGGRVLQYRRPVAVDDYVESTSITHQFDRAVASDQIRAAIALPVRVHGAVRAVVYGAARTPTAFGERTVDAAMAVARRLAHDIAVEEQVQRRVGRILQEQAHRARGDLAPLTGRDVAELNAELVAVAAAVSDPDLRDRLVAPGVQYADHGGLSDRGVGQQQLLELPGVEVDAASDDHVLEPAGDLDEATLVDGPQVAHVQPAVRVDRRAGGVRQLVVLDHVLVAAAADLALLAQRQHFAGGHVDDLDFEMRQRLTHGLRLVLG